MASSGKKKTTMAKLARERRLRERRQNKQARKDARKLAPPDQPDEPGGALNAATTEGAPLDPEQAALSPQAWADGPTLPADPVESRSLDGASAQRQPMS